MQRICDFIAKWMVVLVLIVAAVILWVPTSLTWIGTWVINPMLGIIMFGMGLRQAGRRNFIDNYLRPAEAMNNCK